jgi:ubiquinone/menaquinone biosynthesis C-methylase UbiE
MIVDNTYDAMFSGIIGQEYQMLKLICPFAARLSQLVGEEIVGICQEHNQPLDVLELGGGTGITTLAILSADERLKLLSVDSEPTMQNQAKRSLQQWVDDGRLSFSGDDALTALGKLASSSVDIVASAYTFHNFEASYRRQVITESFRVLKPNGHFINGDRYALDDLDSHTRNTQQEVAGYFKALTEINRLDLLEHWIIHLFSDESENHIMRESVSIQQMIEVGFHSVEVKLRHQVNALLTAKKS